MSGSIGMAEARRDDGELLIVLPLVFNRSDGRIFVEPQAANGLRLWLQHFPRLTLSGPTVDTPPAPDAVAIDSVAGAEGLSFIPLPAVYTPGKFLRTFSPARRALRPAIARARYLHFAIGGLWGDWGTVAALMARRMGRRYAVWTDAVWSQLIAFEAKGDKGLRRIYRTLTARLTDPVERYVIRHSALGLFHGRDTFDAYSRFSSDPHLTHDIHLSPDARISDDEFARKIARPADQPVRIGYFGRVHPIKGPDDWIDVLAGAAAAGGNFIANWYGDGPELDRVRSRVAELGLEEKIRFPGPIADRDLLMQRMRDTDIFLFCHKTAESPRCLIEALVSGTPIVGYGTPYSQDLIEDHGGGVLTPQLDVAALGAAVTQLIGDRARLAELARRAARDGLPFNDQAVFAHRSELMRTIPNP